ncbi:MAG: peptide ABC transporter substrate-binding protein [Clostridiaceae bacterium]|nr:peptide ABC transporter substrate-binding protein [Eubacteriales bacterium]
MTKRIFALSLCFLMVAATLGACTPAAPQETGAVDQTPAPGAPVSEAPAVIDYDAAVYRTLYASEVSTLNYLVASSTWDQQVGANVIDTLVEYDQYAELKPGLAESWEASADGTVWTFHLRQGVKWYDYQGNEIAEVTAQDFVDAAKYVLTAEYESGTSYMISGFIVNAAAYEEGEITDFTQVGVKAVDKYTLEYTTTGNYPFFPTCLTYVCYMPAYGPQLEELGADFGTAADKMYYCGSFILSEFEPQVKHVYLKNYNNWDADNIHITKIERSYNAEESTLGPAMVLRGEINYAELSNDIVDEWLASYPEYLSKERAIPDYSYFFCFNYKPEYDAAWGPENWKIAVTNENFRKSIMYAFNREYAIAATDSQSVSEVIQNTITPRTFTNVNGTDFTALPEFSGIADNFYNEAEAIKYRDLARAELTAAGATFPIQMVITYRTDMADWESESTLIKQQIEGVLGADYVTCVLNGAPADSFLSKTRRAGVYSFMRCNWGADYEDPSTYAEPFAPAFNDDGTHKGNSYNKMDVNLDENNALTPILTEYYAKIEEAKALTDTAARYAAFAEAEALLVEHAILVPYMIMPAYYISTTLDLFEGQYAPCGVSNLRYKGQTIKDHFVTMEEYEASYAAWLAKMGLS